MGEPRARWKVGDRVLWPHPERQGRRNVTVNSPGTVTAIDEPGLPRGVRVKFDELVNGVDECYATHAELVPEKPQLVVICGSTSQLPALAALASTYAQDGREVLYPQDSDRPGSDLDREWMDAIPGASLVVVLRKPDGSIGSQVAEELACAVDHGVPFVLVSPKEGSDG